MNRFIERNLRWIFPLPALIFIIMMVAFPISYTVWLSMTDYSMVTGGIYRFVGLQNYIELFREPRFFNAIKLMFYFTAIALFFETVLGVVVALILNKEFRGKNLTKTLLLLPMVATPVAVGLAWTLFYEPSIGLANYVLKIFGLPPSGWLSSTNAVIPSLALIDIWEWTPMIALICLAGLASLPTEPLESAYVDGATKIQSFFHVTLPLLKPTILVAMALRGIDAFKTFDIIFTLTAGGPGFASETLNIFAYNLGFGYFKFGIASAALMILFVIVLTGSLLILGRNGEPAEKMGRKGRGKAYVR